MTDRSVACAVFDFDGTLTNVEAIRTRFDEACIDILAREVRKSLPEVTEAWHVAACELTSESGWEVGGRIVAPSLGDPFLRATWIGRRVLAAIDPESSASARESLTGRVYHEAYARVPAELRPEARAILDAAIGALAAVAVVSNSEPETVKARLATIGVVERERFRIVGNARKFVVTEETAPASDARAFAALPVARRIDGLSRSVFLRRGNYYAALQGAVDAAACTFDRALVCGDIFELDLALPAALGAQVHLVTRPSTLPHERAAALAEPRGGSSDGLHAVLERIG